jgi:cob(I)alamin adenosyltransferase
MDPKLQPGIIQIYFGSGKGKTTAALGLAFRSLGHNFKVYMIQFMKGNVKYGELNSAEKFKNFKLSQFGRSELIATPQEIDFSEGKKGLGLASEIISSGEWDIVILDEIGIAIEMGLIPVEKIINILKNKPLHVEIVLTGRSMHPKLLELADLVTEMKLVKHPFSTQGLPARKGIEF